MNANEFRQWRENMGLSQQAAANALGLSKSSIELYERGLRRDEKRRVEIPRAVTLACAALQSGLTDFIPTHPAPAGSFQVIKIGLGAFGEQVSRTVVGPPFSEWSDADTYARSEARAFSNSNFNEEHGYWWGRDADGSVCRFIVRAA